MPEAGASCSERFQISSFFRRFVPWLLAVVCPHSSLLPLEPTFPALAAVSCTPQRHPSNALVCGTLCLVLLGSFSKVRVIKGPYTYTKYCLFIIRLRCHNLLTELTNFHRQILALAPALGWTRRKRICVFLARSAQESGGYRFLACATTNPPESYLGESLIREAFPLLHGEA